jgi:hypothetical protein
MTMNHSKQSLLTKAHQDPTKVFERPIEVAHDPRFTLQEKIKILAIWDSLARQLSVATEEGMTGGEPSRLTEVAEARALLGATTSGEKLSTPAKHGG